MVSKMISNWRHARLARWKAMGLIVALLVFAATLVSCATEAPPIPTKEIVGKWVNEGGGWIEFYANGTGYVPGVEGEIAATSFSYSFTDYAHMMITISGQLSTMVEIRVQGDKMTWASQTNNVKFEYTRAK